MRHALEARQPRTAQEVHQHGLHLVVGGVTDCHGLGVQPARLFEEKIVAQVAGRLFERHAVLFGVAAHVAAVHNGGHHQARGGLFDHGGVAV